MAVSRAYAEMVRNNSTLRHHRGVGIVVAEKAVGLVGAMRPHVEALADAEVATAVERAWEAA